ncbi:MAG: transcriptional regulator [Candidatus Omnitrophica bacterium CG23_combo_of_CG06-09_8_20_14_all_40_11]|nr:MAG: transcriptional regulator [Candidatus Omnitrophica bacterium CG23_combo_of_CG06-09_8_20_14_all_40_11]
MVKALENKKYLSPKDLAEYLGISLRTVYLWISLRQIPFYRLSRLIRFNKIEIESWMMKKKVELYN